MGQGPALVSSIALLSQGGPGGPDSPAPRPREVTEGKWHRGLGYIRGGAWALCVCGPTSVQQGVVLAWGLQAQKPLVSPVEGEVLTDQS